MRKTGLLFLLLSMMINSCNNPSENEGESMSYLALGDSYTIGESVYPSERYPVQLADTLNQLGYMVELPSIIATTGWTTTDLLNALEKAELDIPYDLVTLLIGVNNQYRGMSVELYKSEFQTLVEKSIQYAGGKSANVVVISIPDWGVTPFAISRDREKIATEIDAYNQINTDISDSLNVKYIDITGISRRGESETSLIADDGLHPSEVMYKEWVSELVPMVVNIFNPK